MIDGKSILGIIPARGGSKGVPRKNIAMVAGRPLIAWTIEEANKSKLIDRLILSSDDEEIIRVAEKWGCEAPFIRPAELARDDTPGIAPVLHAIEALPENYDYAVLLQPTSPLRRAKDIEGCIIKCFANKAPACVSVTEADKSPHWMYFMDAAGGLMPVLPQPDSIARRQDLPTAYALNGAVYVAEVDWLMKNKSFLSTDTISYIMKREDSCDIDSEFDVVVAEHYLSGSVKL